jgi:hypothetical protein
MDTKSTAAAVTGARHLRVGRNGQDAAAAWSGDRRGALVVCDGCSAGAHSEVGARLASQLVIAYLAAHLERAGDSVLWTGLRTSVVAEIGRLVERMPGDRARALHDHFLFTIVAAAWCGDEVAVWAVGDGAYALGDRVHVIEPFAENEPPYVAYDLLGAAAPAHFEVARATSAIVATDGIDDLATFLDDRFLAHPDALRRELAIRARSTERVDWDARRIERWPAVLQDDGAIALARWS